MNDQSLPAPVPSPVGNYLPFTRSGDLVFLAGQICTENGELRYRGRVGVDVSREDAYAAARICGLNLIAVLEQACEGDLDRMARCVRVGGYVNSAPDFFDQALVINGCSNLFTERFGERGRHARTAISSAPLPRNATVEVDAIFELRTVKRDR